VWCYGLQLQKQLRSDQARLSVEQSRLESWQGQLSQQQATIEQLEAAAEEALKEAREAAAAAMAERDKVRCCWADTCGCILEHTSRMAAFSWLVKHGPSAALEFIAKY
jgi:hypothetical protein